MGEMTLLAAKELERSMDSILTSIKKLLGIQEDYTHFDPEIIVHINSVFVILNQLGVGPDEVFSISDDTTTWNQFLTDGKEIKLVESYMYLRVRLLFDPPANSFLVNSIEKQIEEFEFRQLVQAEEIKGV